MSLFGSISSLNSALQAFTYGQAVTSANIANANTPGYATQNLDLITTSTTNIDGLNLGGGVSATGVSNTRNVFLDNQLRIELGQQGFQQAQLSALQQIAALFPEATSATATTGLQGAIADLATKWTALAALHAAASAATVGAAKTAVVNDLQKLSQMFNVDSQQLYSLQRNLDTQVVNAVTTANSLLDQVVTLNKQIQLGTINPVNGQPNALVDQREQVAEQLSTLLGSSATVTGNGTMVITFNGGTLADGVQAYHLATIPSSVNQSFTGVGYMKYASGQPVDVSSQFTSGTLGGLLVGRDQEVMGARLALDKMAFGVINYSNQINQSYVASDGSTLHALLNGTKASDIQVNANVVANVNYVGDTRDINAPGDLATLQASIQTMDMYQQVASDPTGTLSAGVPIDPTMALSAQNFASPLGASGTLTISVGGNATSVVWNNSMTLNQVIAQINATSGGAFYATFNQASQKLALFSSKPATIYDDSAVGGLASALQLSAVLSSSAPINNGPVITNADSLRNLTLMNQPPNSTNIFTQLQTGTGASGTAVVDGISFNWNRGVALSALVAGLAPAGSGLNASFNGIGAPSGNTQTVSVVRSGLAFNFTAGLTPISYSDKLGNLTDALNLSGVSNASQVLSNLAANLGGQIGNAQAMATQAQNLVANTEQLQKNQSAVDLNVEMAKALQYQRAYEASVRLQYVMDQMLNVLINQMGSSGTSSNTVI